MEINLTRHHGSTGVALVEQASKRRQTYIVRTDLQPHESEEGSGVTFVEHRYPYKPTMEDIMTFVLAVINSETDQRILGGMTWQDKPVWLSVEHQQNWRTALDRAVRTQGSNLPLTVKMGETAIDFPAYHTFTTTEELEQFCDAVDDHIQTCIREGWAKKDAINWTVYEQALDAL